MSEIQPTRPMTDKPRTALIRGDCFMPPGSGEHREHVPVIELEPVLDLLEDIATDLAEIAAWSLHPAAKPMKARQAQQMLEKLEALLRDHGRLK